LRAGIREVVNADDLTSLDEACRRSREISSQILARAHDGEQPARRGRVMTVFSAKGGCGKTTVATNLASALAVDKRVRVCLVDLDLAFGDVAITMQLLPERTLADAQVMEHHVDEVGVRSLVTPHSSGLDTILAPLEPGKAESLSPTLTTELLHELKRSYDYVIVDTPPAFNEQVLAAFDASDVFILLATLDIPALKNLKLTLEMLEMLGYPRDNWNVVLNRSDAKVGLNVSDVEQLIKAPITVAIPSSRDVPATINRGVPIVTDQPGHAVSTAIKRLAAKLTADDGATAPAPRAEGAKHGRRVALFRRGGVPA
jgi:pilus assembly protein CpaE